jgi:uncharacterized protein
MTIAADSPDTTFDTDWEEWHSERERYYGDPLGWLSIVGLHWLTEDFEAHDDLPGRWRADAAGVEVEGLDGARRLEPVEGAPGLLIEDGDRRIEVIRRTGLVGLRVHDPRSPYLQQYRGIPTYPPAQRWRVSGTFAPYDSERIVTTGAVVEGLQHHHTAVGVIDFELGGTAQRLIAFGRTTTSDLHVLFTDATSGVTTYGGARSLAVNAPDSSGAVTLDFNRAANLPCSFTDFATCPVAPPENRLPIAVEAGEKNPRQDDVPTK